MYKIEYTNEMKRNVKLMKKVLPSQRDGSAMIVHRSAVHIFLRAEAYTAFMISVADCFAVLFSGSEDFVLGYFCVFGTYSCSF